MKESKAIYVTRHKIRGDQNIVSKLDSNWDRVYGRSDRYDNYSSYKNSDFACQFDSKRDGCTCRNVFRGEEVYFSKIPKQVYAYHGTRSFTDIGVGSVKALQRRKVRRVYLPETDERGVGGSSELSTYAIRRMRPVKGSFYDHKRTSSKCVGGILEYNTGCVLSEKLSPIVNTKSGTTSPKITEAYKNIEIGSNTVVKKVTTIGTQFEIDNREEKIASKKEESKLEVTSIKVCEPTQKYKKSSSIKKFDKKMKNIERQFSSDSLVQHVHNLEVPSEDITSKTSLDPMENKLEREYRRIFVTKDKDSKPSCEKPIPEFKSASILRRRFDALRRGLTKKDDLKKNSILTKSSQSRDSTPSHKDASVTSDPPSLEARSYSDTKRYTPIQANIIEQDGPRLNYRSEKDSMQYSTTDSDCQGVKGMFKLWGKKFNLDEDSYNKKQATPMSSYSSPKKSEKETEKKEIQKKKPEQETKKEKRFFFFKKKPKEKTKDPCLEPPVKKIENVTAGRCEITDGLTLKMGKLSNRVPAQRGKTSRAPDEGEEITRKRWLRRFLSSTIESARSVNVRWNNTTYTTSSSTVFEILDTVYKNTELFLHSLSEDTSSESYYRSNTKNKVNFIQDIEAWMVPKTIPDRPKEIPVRICSKKDIQHNNIEHSFCNQNVLIDQSKPLSHTIKVVLHSKNLNVTQKVSSEYLRIDIPKDFFDDVTSDESKRNLTSDEEVYKIVEYESDSDSKYVKINNRMEKGDHSQSDIKVIVSVKDSNQLKSKILETVIKRPPMHRDVIIQGSNVHIPKRCDVIGVGIITQRDLREMRKPILKIQNISSSEDSGPQPLLNQKKCEFAESYLQEYYKHWTPLGLDFYSCVSDSQLKSGSEKSLSIHNQQGDGCKSCPNICDDYTASAIISSCETSSGCCYNKANESKKQSKFLGFLKKNNKDDDDFDKTGKRMLPKDSLEVFKKRKIYAQANKAQWNCAEDKPVSVPSIESRGEQGYPDTKGGGVCRNDECPGLIQPLCAPVPRKCPDGKKHVSMPDCETKDVLKNLAEKTGSPGILAFKGCSATKKVIVSCPKNESISEKKSSDMSDSNCKVSCLKKAKQSPEETCPPLPPPQQNVCPVAPPMGSPPPSKCPIPPLPPCPPPSLRMPPPCPPPKSRSVTPPCSPPRRRSDCTRSSPPKNRSPSCSPPKSRSASPPSSPPKSRRPSLPCGPPKSRPASVPYDCARPKSRPTSPCPPPKSRPVSPSCKLHKNRASSPCEPRKSQPGSLPYDCARPKSRTPSPPCSPPKSRFASPSSPLKSRTTSPCPPSKSRSPYPHSDNMPKNPPLTPACQKPSKPQTPKPTCPSKSPPSSGANSPPCPAMKPDNCGVQPPCPSMLPQCPPPLCPASLPPCPKPIQPQPPKGNPRSPCPLKSKPIFPYATDSTPSSGANSPPCPAMKPDNCGVKPPCPSMLPQCPKNKPKNPPPPPCPASLPSCQKPIRPQPPQPNPASPYPAKSKLTFPYATDSPPSSGANSPPCPAMKPDNCGVKPPCPSMLPQCPKKKPKNPPSPPCPGSLPACQKPSRQQPLKPNLTCPSKSPPCPAMKPDNCGVKPPCPSMLLQCPKNMPKNLPQPPCPASSPPCQKQSRTIPGLGFLTDNSTLKVSKKKGLCPHCAAVEKAESKQKGLCPHCAAVEKAESKQKGLCQHCAAIKEAESRQKYLCPHCAAIEKAESKQQCPNFDAIEKVEKSTSKICCCKALKEKKSKKNKETACSSPKSSACPSANQGSQCPSSKSSDESHKSSQSNRSVPSPNSAPISPNLSICSITMSPTLCPPKTQKLSTTQKPPCGKMKTLGPNYEDDSKMPKCRKKKCDKESPWPMNNQDSEQPSPQISAECLSKRMDKIEDDIIECKKCCSIMRNGSNSQDRIPIKDSGHQFRNQIKNANPGCTKSSSKRLTGIFLKKNAPKKKTCPKDCSAAWESEPLEPGIVQLNSRENITIKLKQQSPSTEEIREGMNVKVRDESGRTLYERRDYTSGKNKSSICGNIYDAKLNRISNPVLVTNLATDTQQDVLNTKSEQSLSNLVEIQFKLRIVHGDKTTEINIGKEEDQEEKKEGIHNTPEVYSLKNDEKDEITDGGNPKNDISIKITVKNYKQKSEKRKSEKEKQAAEEYYNKISQKFNTVSTGYSDIYAEPADLIDNVFSVHRATIDLTSSTEKSKTYSAGSVERSEAHSTTTNEKSKIDSAASNEKSKTHSAISNERSNTHSAVMNERSKTHSLASNDVNESVEPTEQEPSNTKSKTSNTVASLSNEELVLITEDETTDHPKTYLPAYDTHYEYLRETYSNYFYKAHPEKLQTEPVTTVAVKSEEKVESQENSKLSKKELLKKVFQRAHAKPKSKGRVRRLREMLKIILTDSSTNDELTITSNELAKDVNFTSVKPNYFKDTDSVNYYKVENAIASMKSKTSLLEPNNYPTKENSDDTDEDSGQTSSRYGGCMCSKVAEKINDPSLNIGCCCRQKKKQDDEVNCDLYEQFNTIMTIDTETQQSTVPCKVKSNKSTNVPVAVITKIKEVATDKFKKLLSPYKQDNEIYIYPSNDIAMLNSELNIETIEKDTDSKSVMKTRSKRKEAEIEYRYPNAADILQCYETKKAVLEIYAEKTYSQNGEHLVAKLPKFICDKESEIEKNYDKIATNSYMSICTKKMFMMSVGR